MKSETTPATSEPRFNFLASLLFWLCLFTASGLFATVSLGPKLLSTLKLEQEYHKNQVRLVSLEHRVEYLQTVAELLRSDPQFSAELARIDLDAARPDEERFAVDISLSLDVSKPHQEVSASNPLPWYAPPLAKFLGHPHAVTGSLAAAATLLLTAFVFLNTRTPEEQDDEYPNNSGPLGWFRNRYRTS